MIYLLRYIFIWEVDFRNIFKFSVYEDYNFVNVKVSRIHKASLILNNERWYGQPL